MSSPKQQQKNILIEQIRTTINVESFFIPRFLVDDIYKWTRRQLEQAGFNKTQKIYRHTHLAIKSSRITCPEKFLRMHTLYKKIKERIDADNIA